MPQRPAQEEAEAHVGRVISSRTTQAASVAIPSKTSIRPSCWRAVRGTSPGHPRVPRSALKASMERSWSAACWQANRRAKDEQSACSLCSLQIRRLGSAGLGVGANQLVLKLTTWDVTMIRPWTWAEMKPEELEAWRGMKRGCACAQECGQARYDGHLGCGSKGPQQGAQWWLRPRWQMSQALTRRHWMLRQRI